MIQEKIFTPLDTTNVKLFIIINSRGIFLFSKNYLIINPNDTEPDKEENKIIELNILLF